MTHSKPTVPESFKRECFSIYEQFFEADMSLFRDLPKNAEKIINQEFVPETAHLDEKNFFDHQINDLRALVARGKSRLTKLREMEEFRKNAVSSLQKMEPYKDLKAYREELAEQCQSLGISRNELRKIPDDAFDITIDKAYDHFLGIKQKAPELTQEIDRKCCQLEKTVQDAAQTIQRRLFEIFSGLIPFPDLKEQLQTLRSTLSTKMLRWQKQFAQAMLTVDEYLLRVLELPYDHDVILLRNELAFRATRLRELREECHRILKEVQHAMRLMIVAGQNHGSLFDENKALVDNLKKYIYNIEHPFQLFLRCTEFENVNELFRSLWIELEGLEKQREMVLQLVYKELPLHIEAIKKRFLHAADDLEEVIKVIQGKRPNIVGPMERELKEVVPDALWSQWQELNSALEKRFPFIRPFSFFMTIDDARKRQSTLFAAEKLDHKIESTRQFAKNQQFIKVFEEEHVDAILELFERQHVIENAAIPAGPMTPGSVAPFGARSPGANLCHPIVGFRHFGSAGIAVENGVEAWDQYEQSMRTTMIQVEQEVLLDIGLIDMHALLDIQEEKLKSALQSCVEKAKEHVPILQQQLTDFETDGIVVKAVADELRQELVTWENEKTVQDSTSRYWLTRLREFCHVLMGVRQLQHVT